MKKIILASIILFFAGLNISMAQLVRVNTIPSYNYIMTEANAAFMEPGTGETREKRDVHVVLTTTSDEGGDVFATVFVVKKDGSQTFGPFTVYEGEPLSVDLPKGVWGVTVNCAWDVTLSVWISKEKNFRQE